VVKANTAIPPAHLLRSIFETAPDYAGAKKLLCETPLAVPAIFLLAGIQDGEGCVIERTETTNAIREMGTDHVSAANHFERLTGPWRPRPIDSSGRAAGARALDGNAQIRDFSWFTAPIANLNSRLVFNTAARTGTLGLMGTRGSAPTTEPFYLPR
jgi:hypothetical protein